MRLAEGRELAIFRLRLLFRALFAVLHCGLEILDAFAQSFSEISKLAGTKDEQCDGQDEQNLRQTQFAKHEVTSRVSPDAL